MGLKSSPRIGPVWALLRRISDSAGLSHCLRNEYAYNEHGDSLSIRDDLLGVPDVDLSVLHSRHDHPPGTLAVDVPPRETVESTQIPSSTLYHQRRRQYNAP